MQGNYGVRIKKQKMNDSALCLFSVDYGFDSIICVDNLKRGKDGQFDCEIKSDEPTNLLKISLKFDLNPTFVVSPSFTPFWALYKAYKEINKQFVFLWKICLCADVAQKDDDSELTECNIYIALKNSDAYYKIVRYVTAANTTHFYKKPRIDYNILSELFHERHFEVLVPFYSGPLARNLLKYGSVCAPRWNGIKPIHLLQNQNLPFDSLINDATIRYCEQNSLPTMAGHHVYYLNNQDAEAHLVYKCIQNRATLAKPEASAHCSMEFSFESYLRKYNPDKLELLKV